MKLTTGVAVGVKLNHGNLFHQYLATVTGCLSIISTGMNYGWPSPSLPHLLHKESHIPISGDEGSWLAAMPCIGAVPGAFVTAYIVDKIGRKTCMLVTAPLYFVTWIMVAYSTSNLMLCVARFISGASDGIAFTAFPMYLGEIAHPKIRGLLGSSIQVSMTLGMMLINVVGSYLNITNTALISAVLPVVHFFTFYFMPESPYYLVMKEKSEEATKSLQTFYRSDDVSTELNEVVECVRQDAENSGTFWELFTVKSNRKAVLIVFGMRAVQQLSGTNAITFYAKTIFEDAEGNISASLATIIYFTLQLVVAIIASFLVDKLGRKPLLICSIIGSGIALLVEGSYVYLNEFTNIDMGDTKYIPLIALLGYVIIFNLGMGIIPVLLLGEMFPTSVKAFALCLAEFFFGCIVTIISKCFQIMKDELGLHVPFFVFSVICVLGLIFIIMCVPETKGRSLEEIQNYLRGKRQNKEETVGPS